MAAEKNETKTIRMPVGIMKKIQKKANLEDRSFTQQIIRILKEWDAANPQ